MARLISIAQRAGAPGISSTQLLSALDQYADILAGMSDAAGLGMITPMHRELALRAARFGVVYKSCGAGGGDLGIAVAESAGELQSFMGEVREIGGFPLESRTSGGVRLESSAAGALQQAARPPAH